MKKEKHFILLLNKMCMNLNNAHLSLCLLRGPCDSHALQSPAQAETQCPLVPPESGWIWVSGEMRAVCLESRSHNSLNVGTEPAKKPEHPCCPLSRLCQMPVCWGGDWRCPVHFLPGWIGWYGGDVCPTLQLLAHHPRIWDTPGSSLSDLARF